MTCPNRTWCCTGPALAAGSTSPADTLTMRLYRSADGGAFQFVDLLAFDGGGLASYADTTVIANHGYSYRLGQFVNGVEIFSGQVSVFLPANFPLSIAPPRPNPVVGSSFGVSFALATNDPAEIVLRQQRLFRRARQVDTVEAALVGACDGELSIDQILAALGQLLDREPADLRATYLPVVRDLVTEGFLRLDLS